MVVGQSAGTGGVAYVDTTVTLRDGTMVYDNNGMTRDPFDPNAPLPTPLGPAGVLVCFESIFPDPARAEVLLPAIDRLRQLTNCNIRPVLVLENNVVEFIKKPIGFGALAETIRKVLGS